MLEVIEIVCMYLSMNIRVYFQNILADGVDFKARLDLTGAKNSFQLLEYYGPQRSKPPDDPFQIYFGRWVCFYCFTCNGFITIVISFLSQLSYIYNF